ncbi:hypothetical protein D3OALGB2SA_2505 [Olavius algarvensis associated proteobacterium Delta 3]|nr:hypothetical protein D3OALGB2SA_2505 [Olavius algarvensis associated proteobacterium Delta 3]
MPEGAEIEILEDTEKLVHFVLPSLPAGELSDELLEKVAGGGILPGIDFTTNVGMQLWPKLPPGAVRGDTLLLNPQSSPAMGEDGWFTSRGFYKQPGGGWSRVNPELRDWIKKHGRPI